MFTFLFSSDRFGTCTMGPQAAPLLSPCVFVYFRGAQKPNASLGYNHASLGATLDLRICTSCNTLRLGYRIASNPASLAFQVFVLFPLLLAYACVNSYTALSPRHHVGGTLRRHPEARRADGSSYSSPLTTCDQVTTPLLKKY
jgi:hypothetical protein